MSALLAVALTLGAQPERQLSWDAPEGCPPAESIAEGLRDISSLQPLDVVARVRRVDQGRWSLELEVRRPLRETLERRLEAESCTALGKAVVLFAAIAAEAGREAPEPPRQPIRDAPEEGVAVAPAQTATEGVAAAPAQTATEGPTFAVGAKVVSDFGTLPSPAPGVGLGGAGEWRGWRVEAVVAHWPEQRRLARGNSKMGGAFEMTALSGRVSYWPLRGVAELSMDLGGEVSWLSGRGVGVEAPERQTVVFPAFVASVTGRWRLTPVLAASLRPEVVLSRAHEVFAIDQVGPVFRPQPVAPRLSLSVELLF
jgi:hypothetical protein